MHSGEEAVEVFPREDFDLVLLDMKLPRISGAEVLFELRRMKPGVEILMMSGHSVTDLLAQAVDGGLHRIYYPPYSADSLLATLQGISGPGLVLAVDDGSCIGDTVEQRMTAAGASVLRSADAADAVTRLASSGVDLLVLDRQPSVISGLEVYWQLKQQGRAVPTLIVTDNPTGETVTIQKLNEFPFCGYFIKPFNPLDLLPALEQKTQ